MKRLTIIILIAVFILGGCANNPVASGRNVGGLVGASGGAFGGSILCKNCKGAAKIAAIGGGALLGWLAGSKAGEFWDEQMKARQVRLIEDVLENNKDNQTSTDTYTKSWRNPNTGQTEQRVVQQSATPLRTYQQNNFQQNPNAFQNMGPGVTCGTYRSDDVRNDNCRPNVNLNQMFSSNSGQYCRDTTITITIDGLSQQPATNQFYSFCRTEQGWRQVPR